MKRFQSLPLLALSALFALICAGCKKIEMPRTQAVFGTVCTIDAYEAGTRKLYDELFGCLLALDSKFSANVPDSEIASINNAAGENKVRVSHEVAEMIRIALSYASLTDGNFDPTVGPLVKLWGINTDHARVPSKAEIDAVLPCVNWRNVAVSDSDDVYLTQKGMALDLGSIVKGYAADMLVAILAKHKVKKAIIDLGGNIYVVGKKTDSTLWNVGIKNPEDPTSVPALSLHISSASVVTSGVYERFFISDGVRYHHILDPKTGYPVNNNLTSVSIVCLSSTAADALSTCLFTLGMERGVKFFQNITKKNTVGGIDSKKESDVVNDGMGMWLFTGVPDNRTDSVCLADDGTPFLEAINGLETGAVALLITADKRIYASKELETAVEIIDGTYSIEAYF